MISPPPWENNGVIEAAVCLAGDVRDIDPNDLVADLAKLTPRQLARRAVVLAAMVDIDQPLSTLRRWTCPAFVKPPPKPKPSKCPQGHPMTPENRLKNGFDASGRQRYVCATCRSKQAIERRKRQAASA